MQKIIELVGELKKTSVKETINSRISEFDNLQQKNKEHFRELVFCILTAGTSAELGIKTIEHLGNTIHHGSEKEIQNKLKEVYRFHTIRAGYIYNARKNFSEIDVFHPEARAHLVEKIKGIGMKEASHFLRNIGFKDYAIVDFHIIDFLEKHKIIERPKTLTPKKYLEIENILRELAQKLDLTLAELDLYLWYLETGKVLK